MKREELKQKNNEKGAITLFVLLAIMFFLIMLIGVFVNVNNRNTSQISELEEIQENYKMEPNEIDRIYAEEIKKEEEEKYSVKYIKKSDFEAGRDIEYNPEEWTNETIILQIKYENTDITINKKVIVREKNGKQNEYDYEDIINNRVEIEENSTLIIYNGNNIKEYEITKIDKTVPELSKITNSSNENWTKERIKLNWKIIETESGIKDVQYRYNGTTWKGLEKENWYEREENEEKDETIYIRVIDNAGNISNVESTKLKIDKTKPMAELEINGGKYSLEPGQTNINTTTTIKAYDAKSGIYETQYGISASNTTEPTMWTVSSNSSLTLNLSGGNNYLWIKVTDKAGNSNIITSNVYKVNYKIVYNANGGTNTPSSQIKNHDESIILAEAIYKANNVFLGWSTSSEATSVTYKAGETYTDNKAVTLYAVWGVANYSINTNPVTYTKTLSEAVTASNAMGNSVITLLRDVTDTTYVNVNKPLTIETNGKILTRTRAIDISGEGVYIQGNGTVQTAETMHLIYNSGTLTIYGDVTVKSNVTESGYYPTILNEGVAYIKGNSKIIGGSYVAVATTGRTEINEKATISATSSTKTVELANNGSMYVKGDSTITNSDTGILKQSTGILQIEGGTIRGNNGQNGGQGILIGQEASNNVTITNGNIDGGYIGILSQSKTATDLTINGGTVQGGTVGVWSQNCATTTTNGGTIKGIYGLIQETAEGGMNVIGETKVEATYGIEVRNVAGLWVGQNANISAINGGVISQTAGAITVSDTPIITTNGNGVWGNSSGPITIYGGTVNADTAVRRTGTGTVTITGGNLKGTENGIYADGTSGHMEISGGNITGNIHGIQNLVGNSIEIKGGTIRGNSMYGLYTTSSLFSDVTGGEVYGYNIAYYANSNVENHIYGSAYIESSNAEAVYLAATGSMWIGGNSRVSGTTGVRQFSSGKLTISDTPSITGRNLDGLGINSNGEVVIYSGSIHGASAGIADYGGANIEMFANVTGDKVGIYGAGTGGTFTISGGTIEGVDGIHVLTNKLIGISNATIKGKSGSGIVFQNYKQETAINNSTISGIYYGVYLGTGANFALTINSCNINSSNMGIVDDGGARIWLVGNTVITATYRGIWKNAIGNVIAGGVTINNSGLLDVRGNTRISTVQGNTIYVSVPNTTVSVQENASIIANVGHGIEYSNNTKGGQMLIGGNCFIQGTKEGDGILSYGSANIEVKDNALVQGDYEGILVRNQDSSTRPSVWIYATDGPNRAGGVLGGTGGFSIGGEGKYYGVVATITGKADGQNGYGIKLIGNTISQSVVNCSAAKLYGALGTITNTNTNSYIY